VSSSNSDTAAAVKRLRQLVSDIPSNENHTIASRGSKNIQDVVICGEEQYARQAILRDDMLSGRRRLRAVVFSCESGSLCGGFGNRLRGMVTSLLLAQADNRAFFIADIDFYEYSHYFQLAEFNYSTRVQHLISDQNLSVRRQSFMDIGGYSALQTADLNISHVLQHDIEFIHTNGLATEFLQNPVYTDLTKQLRLQPHHPQHTVGCSLRALLHPTQYLLDMYDKATYLNQLKIPTIDSNVHARPTPAVRVGVQIRTGGHGAWVDRDFGADAQVNEYGICAQLVSTFAMAAFTPNKPFTPPDIDVLPVSWFVTSDSEQTVGNIVKTYSSSIRHIIRSRGRPFHSERSMFALNASDAHAKKFIDNGFDGVMLDWWTLATSIDYLVFTAESTFSYTAAAFSMTPMVPIPLLSPKVRQQLPSRVDWQFALCYPRTNIDTMEEQ
jgi:hypothetical protein